MKAEEFTKILKPLIEKTVKEVLLQEGVLSRVVSEVARGMQTTIVETKSPSKPRVDDVEKLQEAKRLEIERKRKLLDATGIRGVDVFEGTKQIAESSNPHSALSGVSPDDSGVDISAIQRLSGGKWSRLAGGKNG